MKKTLLSAALALIAVFTAQAQKVGDQISYGGKNYIVQSENMITNPSFDEGVTGWKTGANGNATTAAFTVNTSGGYDGGAYIVGTQNTGKGGTGSLCMDWPIESSKTYYFCYYMKRNSETGAGTEGYVCASQSDKFCGTENNSVNGKVDANCAWTKNDMLVKESSFPYMQFSARWLSGRLGFDGFFLAEVSEVADNTQLLDLISLSENYYSHFGEDASQEYTPFVAAIDAAKTASEATDAATLNAAYAKLSSALLDYRIANASDADPVDVTDRYVKNPNFDDGFANWVNVNEAVNNGMNVRFLSHFDKAGSREAEINGKPTKETSSLQTINNLPKGSYVFQVSSVAIDGTGVKSDSIGVYIMCNGAERPLVTANDSTPEHFTIEGVVLDQSIVIGLRANANCACTYVAIDSIRLIYHGLNATYLTQYIQDACDKINTWEGNNYDKTLPGVIADLEDAVSWGQDQTIENLSEFTSVYDSLTSALSLAKKSITLIETLKSNLTAAEELLNSTLYPGHDTFTAAYDAAINFLQSDDEKITHYSDIVNMIATVEAARIAYLESQEATRENPADKTYLIKYPYFSDSKTWDASKANSYTIPTPWVIKNVVSGSDVWVGKCRAATQADGESDPIIYRSGLNNWSNNFTSLSAYQDLTGLANGIYTISAEVISQEDISGIYDQHVFGTSSLGTINSKLYKDAATEGWNTYTWTTLTTDFVVVTDGNLRIGMASTHNSSVTDGAAGWWQATNFQLHYYGAYNDDDLKGAWNSKLALAQALTAKLLKGDAVQFNADIAAAQALATNGSYIAACAKLDEHWSVAEKAAATLASFYAGQYATTTNEITTLTQANPKSLLNNAINFADTQLGSSIMTADSLTVVTKKLAAYVDYAAYAEEVELLLASKTAYVQTYKDAVSALLTNHYAALNGWFTSPEKESYLKGKLQEAVLAMTKSLAYTAAVGDDVTSLIISNPTIDANAGWKYVAYNVTNYPSSSSQHYLYSGSDNTEAAYTNRYLDAWKNGAAQLRYTTYQVLTDIPNGTYNMTAVARTDGNNCYLFAATAATFKGDTIALDATAKLLTVPNYGAVSGGLWLADSTGLANGTIAEQTDVYNGNGGKGWGWSKLGIDNIVVTNHMMVIGVTCDSVLCYPVFNEYRAFTGSWFSADEFTLNYAVAGNNDNWSIDTKVDGLASQPAINVKDGVVTVNGEKSAVYSIDGRRMPAGTSLDKGVYVVRNGNKSYKIMVK